VWLHIAKGPTGSLGQVEDVEKALIAACEAGGAHIVFVATDGDRVMDKRHKRMFRLFADLLKSMSLGEIVAQLESSETDVFRAFPIRDWLHPAKNLRQRLRNHTLALMPDGPEVDAGTFAGFVHLSVISIPGQSGSMSDRLAVELLSPEVLAAAFESGNSTAPLIIAAAIECATLTEAARLEALSVAFATLGRFYKVMPKATKEYPEQGGR
jgi:hypothetical protein